MGRQSSPQVPLHAQDPGLNKRKGEDFGHPWPQKYNLGSAHGALRAMPRSVGSYMLGSCPEVPGWQSLDFQSINMSFMEHPRLCSMPTEAR